MLIANRVKKVSCGFYPNGQDTSQLCLLSQKVSSYSALDKKESLTISNF